MAPGPAPAGGRRVVIADLLVDGTGGPARERPAVMVDRGRIGTVETRDGDWHAPAGVEVVDLTGRTLLPGLIDAHVHLAFPEPGAVSDPEALAAEAVHRARAALAGGVTTLRDLGSADAIALQLRDAIASGRTQGPRILAAERPLTTTGGHCQWFARIADTGTELVAAVDAVAAAGADVVKIMATGGMATAGSDPYTPQYTAEQLAPAVERAHWLGLHVAAHALCTAGVRNAIAAGVDTLEHGWTITGRRQDFEPSVAEELARSRTVASVTTHEALRSLLPSSAGPGDIAEIRRRLAPHRALAAAGVPLMVHSDAGPGPTRFDDFAASIRAFAVGMGATALDAIRAATGVPAAALGLAGEVGTIEPGRLADLIAVAGDATAELPTRERITHVILGGRTVAVDGRLIS